MGNVYVSLSAAVFFSVWHSVTVHCSLSRNLRAPRAVPQNTRHIALRSHTAATNQALKITEEDSDVFKNRSPVNTAIWPLNQLINSWFILFTVSRHFLMPLWCTVIMVCLWCTCGDIPCVDNEQFKLLREFCIWLHSRVFWEKLYLSRHFDSFSNSVIYMCNMKLHRCTCLQLQLRCYLRAECATLQRFTFKKSQTTGISK